MIQKITKMKITMTQVTIKGKSIKNSMLLSLKSSVSRRKRKNKRLSLKMKHRTKVTGKVLKTARKDNRKCTEGSFLSKYPKTKKNSKENKKKQKSVMTQKAKIDLSDRVIQ